MEPRTKGGPTVAGKRMILLAHSNYASDHAFALEQCDKFIRDANKYLSHSTSDEGTRTAMISCLLVVRRLPFTLPVYY